MAVADVVYRAVAGTVRAGAAALLRVPAVAAVVVVLHVTLKQVSAGTEVLAGAAAAGAVTLLGWAGRRAAVYVSARWLWLPRALGQLGVHLPPGVRTGTWR